MKIFIDYQLISKEREVEGDFTLLALIRSLKAMGINYTFDIDDDYDVAHFITTHHPDDLEYVRSKKKRPIVLSVFADDLDFSESANKALSFKKSSLAMFEKADFLIVPFENQKIILSHQGVTTPIQIVPPGFDYELYKEVSDIERGAFRKYMTIDDDKEYVISFNEYNYSNGFNLLSDLALLYPNYQFYNFGHKKGLFNLSSKWHDDIPENVHFEDSLPGDLYRSAIMNCKVLFVPGYFGYSSYPILLAYTFSKMVIGRKNPLLFDLLQNDKTGWCMDSLDDFVKAFDAVLNENKTLDVLSYVKQFDSKKSGKLLLSCYQLLHKTE